MKKLEQLDTHTDAVGYEVETGTLQSVRGLDRHERPTLLLGSAPGSIKTV